MLRGVCDGEVLLDGDLRMSDEAPACSNSPLNGGEWVRVPVLGKTQQRKTARLGVPNLCDTSTNGLLLAAYLRGIGLLVAGCFIKPVSGGV